MMSPDLIIHWTLFIFALASIVAAYFMNKKGKQNLALLLFTIGGLLFRIFVSKDGFLHVWDERFHALVAKNMSTDLLTPSLYNNPLLPFDYKEWSSNHIWLHKQPFPLWCMAISIKLFGASAMAIRIPSIIFSTLLIPAVYGIGKILFNHRVAFIAAFLCAIHGLTIEQTGGRVATDHIDLYFLCFIGFAVYFGLRFQESQRPFFIFSTALCLAAAILSKWLPALIVLPIWSLSANIYKVPFKKQIIPMLVLIAITAALVLPWQIYIHGKWPLEAAWESQYNRMHIFEALGSERGGIFYHFNRLTIIFGELIFLAIIWLVWKTTKKRTNPKLWILTIWIAVPLLFFTLVKTKMQGYLLFIAPALFILIALFIQYLKRNKSQFRYPKLITILTAALLLLPIRYSIERLKPIKNRSQEMIEFKKECANYDNKTVIFKEEHYIQAMFYSDCAAAYPYAPNLQQIEELKAQGYRLIIKE